MTSSDSRCSSTEQVDTALDDIGRVRAQVLTQPPTATRCLQLAALAESEAAWWEIHSETSRTRAHWRAALAAREHALHTARQWRHQAALQHTSQRTAALAPIGVAV